MKRIVNITDYEAFEKAAKKRRGRSWSKEEMADIAEKEGMKKFKPGRNQITDEDYLSKKKEYDAWVAQKEHERRVEIAQKAAETRRENEERQKREATFLNSVKKMDKIIESLNIKLSKAKSVKTKQKLKRQIKKYSDLRFEDAQRLHSYRSQSQRTRDEKATAKKQVKDLRWALNPGKYDYPDVDTEHASFNRYSFEEDQRIKTEKQAKSDAKQAQKEQKKRYFGYIPDQMHKVEKEKALERLEKDFAAQERKYYRGNNTGARAMYKNLQVAFDEFHQVMNFNAGPSETKRHYDLYMNAKNDLAYSIKIGKEFQKKQQKKQSMEKDLKNQLTQSLNMMNLQSKNDALLKESNEKIRVLSEKIKSYTAKKEYNLNKAEELRKDGSTTRQGRVRQAAKTFEKRIADLNTKIAHIQEKNKQRIEKNEAKLKAHYAASNQSVAEALNRRK